MEAQNDERADELALKVGQLKEISLNIRDEASSSNQTLDNLSSTFDRTAAQLKATVGKLNLMVKAKGGKHLWYTASFIISIFIVMWFLSGHRSDAEFLSPQTIADSDAVSTTAYPTKMAHDGT